MSEQLNFEQMLEETMKNIKVKETLEGRIININKKDEIVIDIGYKADGLIPKSEYSYNENANPREELKIGDKIIAEVIKMNDGEGNVLLSCKKYKMKEVLMLDYFLNRPLLFKTNQEVISQFSENTFENFMTSYKTIEIISPL